MSFHDGPRSLIAKNMKNLSEAPPPGHLELETSEEELETSSVFPNAAGQCIHALTASLEVTQFRGYLLHGSKDLEILILHSGRGRFYDLLLS